MARIVVGLSGGVDSAVAAGLLKAAGHEVIGVTLRTWQAGTSRCCRIDDAWRTTEAIGIPYHVLSCAADFQKLVEWPFLTDRLRGVTPNPCVECNRTVKWKWLIYAADLFQADAVTYQTAQPDIFVGGDVYSGPKFAIDAIAAGREGAISRSLQTIITATTPRRSS